MGAARDGGSAGRDGRFTTQGERMKEKYDFSKARRNPYASRLKGRVSIRTSRQAVVHSDPEILGGTPVFVGTRVPVKNLFEYLEAGDSLEDFLKSFPSVTREQAIAALELARAALESSAHSSR